MFDIQEATEKLQESPLDPKKIYWSIDYHGVYLFRIQRFDADASEADYDPFVSVDKETGEVKEFSVITDGNIAEIEQLVLVAQQARGGDNG